MLYIYICWPFLAIYKHMLRKLQISSFVTFLIWEYFMVMFLTHWSTYFTFLIIQIKQWRWLFCWSILSRWKDLLYHCTWTFWRWLLCFLYLFWMLRFWTLYELCCRRNFIVSLVDIDNNWYVECFYVLIWMFLFIYITYLEITIYLNEFKRISIIILKSYNSMNIPRKKSY